MEETCDVGKIRKYHFLQDKKGTFCTEHLNLFKLGSTVWVVSTAEILRACTYGVVSPIFRGQSIVESAVFFGLKETEVWP